MFPATTFSWSGWSHWSARSSLKSSPATGTYSLGTNALNWGTFVKIMNGGEAYGLGAEMLNFGALIAFMGVNAAAFLRYYVRAETKKLGFPVAARHRFRDLSGTVAEFKPSRDYRRLDLDGRGHRLWHLEDQLVPEGAFV